MGLLSSTVLGFLCNAPNLCRGCRKDICLRVIHQGRYKPQTPLSLCVTVLKVFLSSTINTNYFPLGPETNMLFSVCGNDFHQAFFFKNMTYFNVCVCDKCNLCPYMHIQLHIGGNVDVYNSKSEK